MDDQPVTLWTLRRDDREVACRVRLEPYGIEVDMVTGGAVVATRVFATDDEALEWAQERRGQREAQGWQLAPSAPDQHGPRVA